MCCVTSHCVTSHSHNTHFTDCIAFPFISYAVLYACVGVRTPPAPPINMPTHGAKKGSMTEQAALAAAAALAEVARLSHPYTAQGEWCISRTVLSEEMRRMLVTLAAQHAAWCIDSTRFVAKYGDCVTCDSDIEGTESTHTDSKIRKSEAALEERLRALLSDMESVVQKVLGPKSECAEFLAARFNCSSAKGMIKYNSL